MSRIEIYTERANGAVLPYAEVGNAMTGALAIWMVLLEQYGLVPPKGEPGHDAAVGRALFDGLSQGGAFAQLWAMLPQLYADKPHYGWMLGITFDRVLVARQYWPDVLVAMRAFDEEFHRVGALPKLLAVLTQAQGEREHVAMGFNHTSVSDAYWIVRLDTGEDFVDDGTQPCERPYNTRVDTGHWYLTPEVMQTRGDRVQ